MQKELYDLLKSGKVVCNLDVSKIFKVTRPHANLSLNKLRKSFSKEILSFWKQEKRGSVTMSIKYYKFKEN